jgi:hypothetical protein
MIAAGCLSARYKDGFLPIHLATAFIENDSSATPNGRALRI